MASRLAPVPGNNNASVVSAPPSAAASNPRSVAKSPSLFNTLASTYRAAVGKPPVDPTREVVKSILRIFASGDWEKLGEIKVIVETTLEQTNDDTNPKVVIYNSILSAFKDLGDLVKDVNDAVIPATIDEIEALRLAFIASKRGASGSIRGLKAGIKALVATNVKVAGLIDEAAAGISRFFEEKDTQLKAAKVFVRQQDRAARAASTKRLVPSLVPELSHAKLAQGSMGIASEQEMANTMAELNRMTNANWARVAAAQGQSKVPSLAKPAKLGGRKSRRNRSNKHRRNMTRR